jgi:hypothetical protein
VLSCIRNDHANGSRAWIATTATIGAPVNFINQLRHRTRLQHTATSIQNAPVISALRQTI